MSALANPDNWHQAEDTGGWVWAFYRPDGEPAEAPWLLARDHEEETLP